MESYLWLCKYYNGHRILWSLVKVVYGSANTIMVTEFCGLVYGYAHPRMITEFCGLVYGFLDTIMDTKFCGVLCMALYIA